ncbi:MAG TPA: hypothetical protein VLJ37_12875, partial [bacterium]|nr:hypothetical protein [bacterium]
GNTVTEGCEYGQTSCTVCAADCTEQPGETSYCGDGVTDSTNGEQCDDGGIQPGDGCDANCKNEESTDCGNLSLDNGEQCECQDKSVNCDIGIATVGTGCEQGSTICDKCQCVGGK